MYLAFTPLASVSIVSKLYLYMRSLVWRQVARHDSSIESRSHKARMYTTWYSQLCQQFAPLEISTGLAVPMHDLSNASYPRNPERWNLLAHER